MDVAWGGIGFILNTNARVSVGYYVHLIRQGVSILDLIVLWNDAVSKILRSIFAVLESVWSFFERQFTCGCFEENSGGIFTGDFPDELCAFGNQQIAGVIHYSIFFFQVGRVIHFNLKQSQLRHLKHVEVISFAVKFSTIKYNHRVFLHIRKGVGKVNVTLLHHLKFLSVYFNENLRWNFFSRHLHTHLVVGVFNGCERIVQHVHSERGFLFNDLVVAQQAVGRF